MKTITSILFSVLFLINVHASETSFAPLTDVVQKASWIIKGKVLAASISNSEAGRTIQYAITPTKIVAGKTSVPSKIRLHYTEEVPVIKDKDGKVVGWVSPIYSGSGNEFSVKAGEEYIFLLIANQLSAENSTEILRVESREAEEQIREIKSQTSR
jgi:hypothetical protein